MNLDTKKIGWLQALFNIIVLWGVSHIAIGYCARILHVNTILFACIAFASSALFLLLFSGYGKLAKETLKSLDTWGYGIILLLTYICIFLLFARVTATEASLLLMFGMNVSMLASWFFFGRKPKKLQIFGNIIVFAGLALTCYDTPADVKLWVYSLVVALGSLTTIRFFIAETHKPHQQAINQKEDSKSKVRVVAFIMFIVSLIFTFITIIIATIRYFYKVDESYFFGFPTLTDFLNPATIFAGLIYGAILMAPIRYLEFAANSKIKGENYSTVMAFAPLTTLFWEFATDSITTLDLRTISIYDIVACLLITLGAFLSAYSQIKKKSKTAEYEEFLKVSPQNLDDIEETRSYVIGSLENFDYDYTKTAEALDLPVSVIKAIVNDKNKSICLKDDKIRAVARNYRKNIAEGDFLTGLLNKVGFNLALSQATLETENMSLYFIDLNKFKPVNDTYGHETGDFVLQVVGKRLSKLFGESANIARYGGDEFCILLKNSSKNEEKQIVKSILKTLEEDIILENLNNKIINISASIGAAHYPEDTNNIKDLKNIADEIMYKYKEKKDNIR